MTPLEPKIHLKGKFAPFQTSSILFSFSEMWAKYIFWIESERTVSEFRKRKRNFLCCVHLLRKVGTWNFHVAVVQRWPKNVQKSVMHVQSCCFTNINLLLFLPFSLLLPSPSLLPKLPFVVIQKFCFHGNVTSPFTSLLVLFNSRRSIWPTDQKLVMVSAPYMYRPLNPRVN